ncbi:MAG: hypothetical protein ACYSU6_03940 [Planctomycetota bacterium]|jgi:NADH:ubiquinone oxidoreductase subunit 5 (subunit L)/multisubunit Na+/H+ antiporter MnhA subunit
MNKIHTLTKVTLTLMALFFIVRIVPQLIIPFYRLYHEPSWESAGALVSALLAVGVAIAALVYAFIYKRDILAKRIVGSQGQPESSPEIPWLPMVLRLICIASGIYFLSIVLWYTTNVINQLAAFKAQTYADSGHKVIHTYAPFISRSLLPWVIMLICGVYLLCGAPHFVRWQVKKILQQCKDRVETT